MLILESFYGARFSVLRKWRMCYKPAQWHIPKIAGQGDLAPNISHFHLVFTGHELNRLGTEIIPTFTLKAKQEDSSQTTATLGKPWGFWLEKILISISPPSFSQLQMQVHALPNAQPWRHVLFPRFPLCGNSSKIHS